MVASRPDFARRVALACIAGVGLDLAMAAQVRTDDWIEVNADSMRVDYEHNSLQMRNVDMANRQGTMRIRAQEANARGVELSFNNSQWEFIGDVHMEVDGAVLDAATATVSFAANRLGSARAVGGPAQFSHLVPGSTQRNQGRAGTIDFDAGKSLLTLSGDVWYSDGRNEINSPVLVYSLTDRSIEKAAGDGERVRLIIRPGTGSTSPRSPPATSPPATTAPQPPAAR